MEDKGNKLEFAVSWINCQSVRNKTNEVVDYVKDHDVDIVALTESWLSDNEQNNNKVIGDKTLVVIVSDTWLDQDKEADEWAYYLRRHYP